MKIKLDDNHYLNSDAYCFWITCECKSRNGKSYEKRVSGFCRGFEDAVDNYIDGRIKTSTSDDIIQIRNDVKAIKTMVKEWMRNYETEKKK